VSDRGLVISWLISSQGGRSPEGAGQGLSLYAEKQSDGMGHGVVQLGAGGFYDTGRDAQ
jgi:hypothetical protein